MNLYRKTLLFLTALCITLCARLIKRSEPLPITKRAPSSDGFARLEISKNPPEQSGGFFVAQRTSCEISFQPQPDVGHKPIAGIG